ncbi:TIGR01777 family oxidoreductase [Paenibacillus sp. GSMTC-2017]|uniref:TIGR01777 family oxidoreductase n=1 Tax=Paenibacillus sp. GSMTC-2017 TaxID=2794350 RepID=UPI0018D5C661|nr:TIGR01777 family oxidoreductase [Paenibacillus sp. GSMTC-2017]MBH5317466.1 TIGR01777 family oxidoreductase [Paenibacillus sp. GSMTC-2017]
MRVAIAGGTGFIGKALTNALLKRGDQVWIITRSRSVKAIHIHRMLRFVTWSELEVDSSQLEGCDAIVNLAGESINQRWTTSAKDRILHSRQWAAAKVATLMESLSQKPSVVINASGISAYGISQDEVFDEDSKTNVTDYLSEVVQLWEEAADRISVDRLVKLRIGLVLDRKGGAFPLMILPYRLFGGGKIGTGKQGLSWIHIEDMIGLILYCLDNDKMRGAVNASAPEPVSNNTFGQAIGHALGRPHWFPVPALLMRTFFGEMSTLLLDGQRALPKKALDNGYVFRYPTVKGALSQLIGK